MPRNAFTRHLPHEFDFARLMENVEVGEKHGSDLRKLILKAMAVNDLRRLLYDKGYRFHSVFPSLANVVRAIKEAQELFGRGRHEYANFSRKGDTIKIVSSNGGRFTIDDSDQEVPQKGD